MLKNFCRDRLVWFLLAGAALFAAEYFYLRAQDYVINIDLPLVEKLATQWEGQTKQRPTARELDALVEGYIREEILVREAGRLGLDEDDIIVRRRLAQKVEFFLGDSENIATPDIAAAKKYFAENKSRYATPAKLSLRHIFLEEESQAEQVLRELRGRAARGEGWRRLGAPFMLQREYGKTPERELGEIFGREFAKTLFANADNREWFGAVRSAFGWHIVQIINFAPAAPANFDDAAPSVVKDWQAELSAEAKAKNWQALRAQYEIKLLPLDDE